MPNTTTYPDLAPGESALAEAALGGTTAVLTDRRVVVVGPSLEQSLPLAHIALVRVRFERIARWLALGAALIAAASVMLAVASPLRALLLHQTVALEPAATAERTGNPERRGGVASGLQQVLGGVAALVAFFPAIAWLAVTSGVVLVALGAFGRTVVTLAAGGAEVELGLRGRSRALREFVGEIGRHLPGPRL